MLNQESGLDAYDHPVRFFNKKNATFVSQIRNELNER